MTPELKQRAAALLEAYRQRGLMVATAESCTGGLIAGLLTEVPGSSAVVERGFVTYSNEAKTEMLGLPADLIAQHGAVSEPVARAMAAGALGRSRADVAVSITGIAGPEGGTPEKPVGLVWLSVGHGDGRRLTRSVTLPGSRADVRDRSTTIALHLVRRLLLSAG